MQWQLVIINVMQQTLIKVKSSSSCSRAWPSLAPAYLIYFSDGPRRRRPVSKRKNKLGLNWAKLSSNWNWGLLWLRFAALHWWLPTTIAYPEPNKPVNLLAYWLAYLHAYLLTCMLTCLLTFQYTYLLTVNSNRPKSHNSYPLNFHRLYLVNFKFMIYLPG